MMETAHKELYEAPMTEVFEVKSEGIICQSDPQYRGLNEVEEEW